MSPTYYSTAEEKLALQTVEFPYYMYMYYKFKCNGVVATLLSNYFAITFR